MSIYRRWVLLSVGGPLIDAGFTVRLMDAELAPLSTSDMVREVGRLQTDVVQIGHWGSSTAHPTVVELSRALKRVMPRLAIIHGGVHRYARIGRRVWFHEVLEFLFTTRPPKRGPTLRQFMGPSLAERECALESKRVSRTG